MSFTTQYVTGVNSPTWTGTDMLLSWTSTAPAGMVSQVYLDGNLSWHGIKSSVRLPWPAQPTAIDIGHVDAADARTAFPSALPAKVATRASLSWTGGTFLDPGGNRDILGFTIYGSSAPGGAINYSAPLATVPAYTPGNVTDGFGLAGFGSGSFGMASASYSWSSNPLQSGVWSFAVGAFGSSGVIGATAVTSVTISAPPAPPAPLPGTMQRLSYSLVPSGGPMPAAEISWSPPPYW